MGELSTEHNDFRAIWNSQLPLSYVFLTPSLRVANLVLQVLVERNGLLPPHAQLGCHALTQYHHIC